MDESTGGENHEGVHLSLVQYSPRKLFIFVWNFWLLRMDAWI